MAYVYEHWRSDTCEPFWVGKGSGGRANLKARRNKYHANIVAMLERDGFELVVKIIADDLTDEQAFALEIERIALWKALGIKLANSSVGGRGGLSGCKRSAESRAKQSQTTTGRKLSEVHRQKVVDRVRSPEARAQMSALHSGKKRPPETGARISASLKARWADPDCRARLLDAKKKCSAKPVSEETRAKMRAAKTPEARKRISEAVKKQWENPVFRKLVSDTMKQTNAARGSDKCAT